MSDLLTRMEKPISKVLARVFQEPNLTAEITYRLFQGQDDTGEDVFHDYSVVAIPARATRGNSNALNRVAIRTGDRRYLIRDVDLPGGVSVDELSTNDRIVHGAGSQELVVVGIDTSLGFVVEVSVRGE